MTVKSVFYNGACTVTVARGGSTISYDGTLNLGDSANFTDSSYGAMSVAVDSVGEVTLENLGGLGIEDSFSVIVSPISYSLADVDGIYAANPSSNTGEGSATANSLFYIFFINGDPSVDLSAQDSPDRIEVDTENPSSNTNNPVLRFTPQVVVPDPNVYSDCNEIGRTSRNYVTAYSIDRPQFIKGRRYQKRCLIGDFNGALATDRLITSARFDCSGPWAVFMSNARIIEGQRKVAVDISLNYAGWSGIRAQVTLDNGEVYACEWSISVTNVPLYPGDYYPPSNGPYTLTTEV